MVISKHTFTLTVFTSCHALDIAPKNNAGKAKIPTVFFSTV